MNLKICFLLHRFGPLKFFILFIIHPIWFFKLRYFKPTPRWDKEKGILYLPKSCPLQAIRVQGDTKFLKNIACLEACKQLHKIGALTDYLVPSIVIEEAEAEEFGKFLCL
jgi:hypothetical protein